MVRVRSSRVGGKQLVVLLGGGGQVLVGEAESCAVQLDHRLDVELEKPQGCVPAAEKRLDGGLVRAFGVWWSAGTPAVTATTAFLPASCEAEPSMVKAQPRVKTLSCHCLNRGVVLY